MEEPLYPSILPQLGDPMNSTQLERMASERFGLLAVAPVREMHAGNINRTAVVETAEGSIVMQEMNISVFPDPEALMANTAKVIERQIEHNLPTLTFLPTVDGDWTTDLDGVPWRCYEYVAGGVIQPILTSEDAQSTARAFGRFARAIDGLELVEHVAGYHDFDARVVAFEDVAASDELGRGSDCAETVADLMTMIDRLRLASGYDSLKRVPVRNAHNDAKGPNCVVGPTGRRTIIDLDTTMPGTILSDIGELIRSCTRELNEAPPQRLMSQIEAVNRGFLAGYGGDLTGDERDAMLLAGPLMAIENASRFLADHLNGDKYYGAAEPNQNLDRAVAQLALGRRLAEAIEWATAA